MSKRFYGGIFYEPKLMIELGVEHPISLLYYLTYENASYGIEIVKIQFNEDSKITREVGVIEDISPNEQEVISIINKLKEHYVTPIVMKDIIDDMKYEISPTIITTRT